MEQTGRADKMLSTLGRLELAETSLQRLPLLVLTWLVLEGPTDRRRIRELFWPDADGAASHMRVALTKLRAALPGMALTGDVLSVTLPCDALDLQLAPHPHRMYPGAFLADVRTDHLSAEFQEWVLEKREQLAEVVQLGLVREAEQSVSPLQASLLAEQAVGVAGAPPLNPELISRIQALALPGTPLDATLRRERATLDGAFPAVPVASSLLGRERELVQLLAFAGGEGAQALHVVGPGGVGKTALLLAAVREWQALGHPAVYLSLEPLRSLAEVAAQLARALGVTRPVANHTFGGLGQDLATRSLLVVLDGTDQRPEWLLALSDLLSAAPSVRILTAGRAAWADSWPHLLLTGLAVPAPQDSGAALLGAPAVQVLLRTAGPYAPSLAQDLPSLGVIARRVQGLPLALRLVGRWLHQRTLPEVVHLLQGQASEADATSLLHPILRRSWYDRTTEEQQALLLLAQAPDWHRDDLAAIAGLSRQQVQPLVEYGLLLQQEERFQVLPLLTAWLRTRQVDDPALAERHAEHHLARLLKASPTDTRLVAEQANVLQALKWRADQNRVEVLAIARLAQHFERLGLCNAGEAVLTELDAHLADKAARATLQVHRAWLAFRTGRMRDAEGLIRAVLQSEGSGEEPAFQRAVMQAHNVLAVLDGHRGMPERATASLQRAVQLARVLNDQERASVYLSNLAIQQKNLGRYAEALMALAEARAHHESQGNWELVWGDELRALQVRLDDPESDPRRMLEEAQRLAERVEKASPQLRGLVLLAAAQAALLLGEADLALRYATQVKSQGGRSPAPTLRAAAELAAARAHYLRFDTPAARQALLAAASLCLELQDDAGLLDSLIVLAEDLVYASPRLAHQLATVVVEHRASNAAQRRRSAQLVNPLASVEDGALPLAYWIGVGLKEIGARGTTKGLAHGPP